MTTEAPAPLAADASTFPVYNPATGQAFTRVPDCSPAQLDAVVQAAVDAFAEWSRDEGSRRLSLAAAADKLAAAIDDLAVPLTREQGKPLVEAAMELQSAVQWLKYYAELEDPSQVLQDDDAAYIEVVRRPIGPVAAITPWNFPIALSIWKIAPALRAGNTVVVKPSPFTPLTTIKVIELLAEIFPPGVLSVVTGRDPLGAQLAAHPQIRKISFTGSTATGKKVAALAAGDLKRVTLELGGNDPAIVLPDADIAKVAPHVFMSAMANNGQICMAVKRTYVHTSQYAEFVAAMAETAKMIKLGPGEDPSSTHGPLNNLAQLDRVRDLVDDAIEGGARVVTGGKQWGTEGYFYEPTILADVSDGMRVVDEEQFGPVVPVVPYTTVEEAIERANASHYGLGSSIWGQDIDYAQQLAVRMEAGTTWINSHLMVSPSQPFGGAKWSGIGVENGPWGLHGFSETHVLYTSR